MNTFTRVRRLPFEALVLFIIEKTNASLSVCLADFFQEYGVRIPTKSSLTQARSSLCYKAFKRLNLFLGKLFYRTGKIKKWKGFRILAVDGSTLRLPNHESLASKFSRHSFGAKKTVDRWMSRVSFLYDVLNEVVIDAQMESFDTSEATLCDAHRGFMRKGDLVIFDRYYASHYLFSILSHKKIHYLFRMRDHSWTCVKELMASQLKEKVVELQAYKYSKVAKKIPANVNKVVKVRLIKQVTRSGEVKVFATSLLDKDQYTRSSIINLYKQRWGVEEAYKTLKARLDVIHFSGITLQAVQQDFYANVLLISLTSILKSQLPTKLKTKNSTQNKNKRVPIINNTYALYQTKRLLKRIYFRFKQLRLWINEFLDLVKSTIEYSRKGQSNPRMPDKGRQRGYAQNYKPI